MRENEDHFGICPICLKKNKLSRMVLRFYNIEEGIYTCENNECWYSLTNGAEVMRFNLWSDLQPHLSFLNEIGVMVKQLSSDNSNNVNDDSLKIDKIDDLLTEYNQIIGSLSNYSSHDVAIDFDSGYSSSENSVCDDGQNLRHVNNDNSSIIIDENESSSNMILKLNDDSDFNQKNIVFNCRNDNILDFDDILKSFSDANCDLNDEP